MIELSKFNLLSILLFYFKFDIDGALHRIPYTAHINYDISFFCGDCVQFYRHMRMMIDIELY